MFLSFALVLSVRRRFSVRETGAVTGGAMLVLLMLALDESSVSNYGSKVFLAAMGGGLAQYGFDAYRARTRSSLSTPEGTNPPH